MDEEFDIMIGEEDDDLEERIDSLGLDDD